MTDLKDELRAHGYITTYSGDRFYYENPGPFRLRDVAHALSYLPRFSGHTRFFYSVAQHSLMVSEMLERHHFSLAEQAAALLHDAHEAYTGDIPTPLKWACPALQALEHRIAVALRKALLPLGLDEDVFVEMKAYDTLALHIEADALLNPVPVWVNGPLETPFQVLEVPVEVVERRFLDRAAHLGL